MKLRYSKEFQLILQVFTRISAQCQFLGFLLFVHIISRKKLLEFSQEHADAFTPLDDWYRIAKTARWKHLDEVRLDFSSAEAVGNFTIFNIKGNNYRLIASIDYGEHVTFAALTLNPSPKRGEGL